MANQIGDRCITCGRCTERCPRKCIYPGPEHYEIDAERCVSCGICTITCPMGAIAPADGKGGANHAG